LLAAGGTGGHLFPAEALAAALAARGVAVELATDARAVGYGGKFPARAMHVIPSATPRGPFGYAKAGAVIALGVATAYRLLGRLRPAAVVGFGGYPSIPAVLAAVLRRIPSVIHEQNGVMGRANRLLAPRGGAASADGGSRARARHLCAPARHRRGGAVLSGSPGAHRGGAPRGVALGRVDRRGACRAQPPGRAGAAAPRPRPGSARQRQGPRSRRRRHTPAPESLHS